MSPHTDGTNFPSRCDLWRLRDCNSHTQTRMTINPWARNVAGRLLPRQILPGDNICSVSLHCFYRCCWLPLICTSWYSKAERHHPRCVCSSNLSERCESTRGGDSLGRVGWDVFFMTILCYNLFNLNKQVKIRIKFRFVKIEKNVGYFKPFNQIEPHC